MDLRARILLAIGAASLGGVVACRDGQTPADGSIDASCGAWSDADAAAQDAGAVDGLQPPDDAGITDLPRDAGIDMRLTIRRPFLVGGSLRHAAAAARSDWLDEMADGIYLPESTRIQLAAGWLQDALEEHASIAAFSRFTLSMLAVGAPADLIAMSQRAGLDELRHARGCFALARRYGSGPVGPGPLALEDALPAMDLAELAALTAEEGCIGESLGALLAAEQARLASDAVVRAFLNRLAADEARHAELAWRFVRWALERDQRAGVSQPTVANAVEDAMARALAELSRPSLRHYDVDVDLFHAHGRLLCAEAHAISLRGAREIITPCLRQLLAPRALRHDPARA